MRSYIITNPIKHSNLYQNLADYSCSKRNLTFIEYGRRITYTIYEIIAEPEDLTALKIRYPNLRITDQPYWQLSKEELSSH